MMKHVLTSPFYSINEKLASHKSAQAHIYADMIRQAGYDLDMNIGNKITDFSDYDTMWVYHGNDFFGSLNLFGGVKNYGGVQDLVNFSKFKGSVYSLNIDFPDYSDMIKSRLKGEYPEIWDMIDFDNLEDMTKRAKTIVHPNATDKLVVGDSHSICMYRPGWMVKSIPFKTLNGALNDGLDIHLGKTIKKVEFYFGNIDIRHHLCRLDGDPIENTKDLVKRYVEQVESLDIPHVSIYEPLPIEDESRVVPKSGWYKGKPFWGSWEERNEVRKTFIDTLLNESKRTKIKLWTGYLKNSVGQLDFAYMEKPRSVHLSREFYPYWTGQNINTLEDFLG